MNQTSLRGEKGMNRWSGNLETYAKRKKASGEGASRAEAALKSGPTAFTL